jgi:hypothetical protein
MTTRFVLVISLSLAASAAAQPRASVPADPVTANFREFRAALERGDGVAADAAAARALEESEAQNGPKTAVLALNLATLRLDRGEPDAAYAPARRAHELATADRASGVDPLIAALALGRAELAVENAAGTARLSDAIAQAERRGDLDNEAYSASVDLARASFERGQYATAREAWAASVRLAAGSADEADVARGLARTGEGAAIFMQAVKQHGPGAAAIPVAALDARAVREASAAFAEALARLRPFADGSGETALTLAQRAYAQALAWEGALRAKLQAQGDSLPETNFSGATASERCAVRLVAEPAPDYPRDALLGSGFGAVVMRVRTDTRGEIVERQIAAAIPSGSFGEAVAAVADEWRVEVAPAAQPGCRRDGTHYTPILFVAEGAEGAPAVTDEIIVLGRTLPALRLEIERAENAVFDRFNALNKSDDFDIHCTMEIATGTHIPQRVCAPVFLRDAQARAGTDTVLGLQGFSFGAGSEQYYAGVSSYQYRQLQEQMRGLVREDRELFDALQHLMELRQKSKEAASARRER